ncbi:hypothetical protein M2E15_2920 [Bacillus mycoides]|uniref:hypothetical protein n=1 Tax=Bacillus mycoides TaxID=1405 RepID=UPI00073F8332|nr:hypothetical protein [Bacillus mycoides]KUH46056.1 hypothetical protein M2E15_2920 [Bacillus mycoides]
MLNRVIYEGQVYYKVNDVAVLFDLSQYKMKKTLEKQGIKKGKLAGFGRTLFILEKNVGKIEVGGEITIIETEFKESMRKEAVKKADEVQAEETKNEKEEVKSETEKEKEVETTVNNNDIKTELDTEKIEEPQEEHKRVIQKGRYLFVQFHKADKQDVGHEICNKHMGKNNKFLDGTLDDIEAMKDTVSELEKVAAEMKLDEIIAKKKLEAKKELSA